MPLLTQARAFCREEARPNSGFTNTLTLTLIRTLDMAQMKADRVWSTDVHDVQEIEGNKRLSAKETLACGARILHVLNMFRVRGTRQTKDISNDTTTYLWALHDLEGG